MNVGKELKLWGRCMYVIHAYKILCHQDVFNLLLWLHVCVILPSCFRFNNNSSNPEHLHFYNIFFLLYNSSYLFPSSMPLRLPFSILLSPLCACLFACLFSKFAFNLQNSYDSLKPQYYKVFRIPYAVCSLLISCSISSNLIHF